MKVDRARSPPSGPSSAIRRDDRGVSSTVTHALALSITAILISGLLYTAGGLIEDQREHSAREQLYTVGNRIADDLSRAARLAQDGGNVSFRASHPTSIAGRQYDVRLLTGNDCDSDLFTADTCLDLELQDGQAQVMVPVQNETAVAFEEKTTGVYRISADANTSAPPTSVPRSRRDLRVGIGDDVGAFGSGSVLNLTNRDPIAGFTFDPGQPSTSSTVTFQNDTEDLDGRIIDYEWDLGDGTVVSGPDERTVDHSYADPGKYTVTLTVTDDDGATDNVSKVVSVGGLSYDDDASAEALNASDGIVHGSVKFNVTNQHSEEIVIREVLIDPEDDSIDRLDAEDDADEIYVDGDVLVGGYSEPETIHDGGRIYDIADEGMGPARLSGSSTAQVWLEGFDRDNDPTSKADMSTEEVFVAMRYEVNGSFYTAQFTLNAAGSGNQPPDPAFDYTCTGTSCTFDDDGSDDPDGSVENYAWNFDDGTTVSGPSETTVTHDFPANGTYDVRLTVTDDDGVSATVTETVLLGDPGPPVVFAVDAGGNGMTVNGVTYEEDTTSNPHTFHVGDNHDASTADSIDNTSSADLYRTTRHGETGGWIADPGSFGYEVPVPNGEYEITFKFAEIQDTWWADREFDVNVESSSEVSNLNVEDTVGRDHALDVSRTVDVNDGELTIEFYPESNLLAPMVNAIVVEQLDAVAFQEDDGTSEQVVMEAESFHRAVPGNGRDASGDDMSGDSWVTVSDPSASAGTALDGQPNNGDSAGDTENGPRLDYYVDVANTGTYYVWVRMNCPSAGSADDSVHVGLDGEPATYGGSGLNANASTYCHDESGWMWASHAAGSRATVDVNSAGQHTVNVWMNDDGTQIDQVVLTTDSSYDPTGTTPTESAES